MNHALARLRAKRYAQGKNQAQTTAQKLTKTIIKEAAANPDEML